MAPGPSWCRMASTVRSRAARRRRSASSKRSPCTAASRARFVAPTPSSRSGSTSAVTARSNSPRAALQITSVRSVGSATDSDRVRVRKSDERTLRSTVRARRPCCRSRQARWSTRSSSQARSTLRSPTSWANVVSVLSDFASRSGTTARSSRPWARCQTWRPASPKCSTRSRSGRAASWPTVRMPRACSRFSPRAPTPQTRPTGSGARNSATRSAGRMTQPSGLPRSPASLARNLLGATPTEATRPVSARTRALMARAISGAGPNSPSQPRTSRNASSRLSGSTSGVKLRKMSRSWWAMVA